MVFAYVSIQGWIIDPYVYSLFYGSHEVLLLSPHNAKILYRDLVTSGVIMVKYWGGGLEMFLEMFSKGPGWFTNVFIIALHPVTPISVDDSTSLFHRILVLGSHQEVFDGCTSFKIHLHPMVTAHFLKAFTEPSVVWNNNMRFLGDAGSRFVLVVIVLDFLILSWFYWGPMQGICI